MHCLAMEKNKNASPVVQIGIRRRVIQVPVEQAIIRAIIPVTTEQRTTRTPKPLFHLVQDQVLFCGLGTPRPRLKEPS